MDVLSSRILLRPWRPGPQPPLLPRPARPGHLPGIRPPEDPGLVFFLGQGLLEVSGHAAGPPGRSVMIWIQVRDVRAEHARLAAAGVPIVREPAAEPWGLIEMWIEDPDGIRIVLVEVPAGHPLRGDPRPALPPGPTNPIPHPSTLQRDGIPAPARYAGMCSNLPRQAVSRLLEETGGNPLYCRAVLEEAAAEGVGLDGTLRVPRSLAGLVLARVGALSPAARQLVEAAAVLGHHCELTAAAGLAGLADLVPALGEAVAAGILMEEPGRAVAEIGFSHLLVQRAVYGDLSPARRRRLHQRAAGLVDRDRALGHRVAAAAGPDDGLAAELEAASRERGDLATAAGHHGAAAAAFETAWHRAQGLQAPLALAQLEISDARRLRAVGRPEQAVARLCSARQRLLTLGARPYVDICDRELAAAGVPARRTATALPGLTPAEQAVAGLVAAGRSNRQTATELYVSVKTVEFHLGHIFDKLGIRSRKDLITRMGALASRPAESERPGYGVR